MFDLFLHLENNVLTVDRMLKGLAKEHPEYGAALIYNNLRPEHTFQLLDLPLFITFELASLAGGHRIKDLARQIWNAESNGNIHALSEAANSLNEYLLLVTSPLVPDRESIRIEDLALCLTNYIVIRHALYNYLKEGEREADLPWSETIRWADLPPESRIAYFLSMRWPAMIVMYMNHYLSQVSSGLKAASDEILDELPYPVYPIVPEDEDQETEGNVLGQAIALHRKDQEYYRLWLRFFYSGRKDFHFEPIWDEEAPYLETMVNLLADIELEARDMSREFSTAWNDLVRSPERLQYDQGSFMGVHLDFLGTQDDAFLKFGRGLPHQSG